MSQAIEHSQGAEMDFRVRPQVLMDFAHVWAERHGKHGGFSITRLSEKIKTRVMSDLQSGQAVDARLRTGQSVQMVDLSDELSGFVYYAMVQKNNGHNELAAIVDDIQKEEMVGNPEDSAEDSLPESPSQNGKKVVAEKEISGTDPDELVLLRYSNCDGKEHTEEVKRGELNRMILTLLADGIQIDSMKVWSNGRRPHIDVVL